MEGICDDPVHIGIALPQQIHRVPGDIEAGQLQTLIAQRVCGCCHNGAVAAANVDHLLRCREGAHGREVFAPELIQPRMAGAANAELSALFHAAPVSIPARIG